VEDKGGGVVQMVWIPTKIEIVISADFGMDVDPDWAQVAMGGTVVFRAEKVNARVFFPELVLQPVVGDAAEAATKIGADYMVFDIKAGETLTFKASSSKEVKLAYFVSYELISNVLEAVQIPPVFVIKKVS
jgi:hypothetical protein